jgi:hypothetical protein
MAMEKTVANIPNKNVTATAGLPEITGREYSVFQLSPDHRRMQ